MKVYSYDVNVENQPPRIETQDLPSMFLFPAYHKNPPYLRYMSSPKVSEMANYIKKHADIKFEIGQDLAYME